MSRDYRDRDEDNYRYRERERYDRDDRGRDRESERDRPAPRRGGDRDDDRNPPSTSLLVRNLSFRIRADEIRRLMERYGEVRDVYIPLDYYSKRPRGFAFVEFLDPRDARDAQEALDRYVMDGREIVVVFAKEKRKTPGEMRTDYRGGGSDDRGAPRGRAGSRERGDPDERPSRSRRDASPDERNRSRSRERTRSNEDRPDEDDIKRSPSRSASRSRSPSRERSVHDGSPVPVKDRADEDD